MAGEISGEQVVILESIKGDVSVACATALAQTQHRHRKQQAAQTNHLNKNRGITNSHGKKRNNGSWNKVVKLGQSLAEQSHGFIIWGQSNPETFIFLTQLTRNYFTGSPFGQPLNAQIWGQILAWVIMLVICWDGN
jgi:hypothetical protein